MHPYNVMLVKMGVGFRKIYIWPGLGDVVRSCLRPQTPIDGIPHSHHLYAECFCTLICFVWKYGSFHYYACAGGGGFWKIYVGPGLGGLVMSWLRLQTSVDCNLQFTYMSYEDNVF